MEGVHEAVVVDHHARYAVGGAITVPTGHSSRLVHITQKLGDRILDREVGTVERTY